MSERVTKTCIECGRPVEVSRQAVDFLSGAMMAQLRARFSDSGPVAKIEAAICDDCNRKQIEAIRAADVAEMDAHNEARRWRAMGIADSTVEEAEGVHPLIQPFVDMGNPPAGKHLHPLMQMFLDGRLIAGSESRGSLFMCGPTGNGKTTIAVQMLRELYRSTGTDFVYREEGNMIANLKRFREEVDRTGRTVADEERDLLRTTPVLVIDDFGSQTPTEFVSSVTFSILDARYQNQNLKTILISNARSLDALENDPRAKHIDGRIARRIRDWCVVAELSEWERSYNTWVEDQRRRRQRSQGAA
jgi:DNA replication protein DnaC